MAAWNVKIMEEFSNQPWVELFSSSHFNALETEMTIENAAQKQETESSSMKLRKEDMLLYGLCPAQDEFFLTICERCNLLVKPQALKTHISIRHNSVNTTSCQFPTHMTKHNVGNNSDGLFKNPGDYGGSKSQPSTPKCRTRKSKNSNRNNPNNDNCSGNNNTNNGKNGGTAAGLKNVKSFPSFSSTSSDLAKQNCNLSLTSQNDADVNDNEKLNCSSKCKKTIASSKVVDDNIPECDEVVSDDDPIIKDKSFIEIASMDSDVMSIMTSLDESFRDKNDDDDQSDCISDILLPPKLEPENVFINDVEDHVTIFDSSEFVNIIPGKNVKDNEVTNKHLSHRKIMLANVLKQKLPSVGFCTDKNVSSPTKIDKTLASTKCMYSQANNRVLYIQPNLINLKSGLHVKSVITGQSQSSSSSSSSPTTTSTTITVSSSSSSLPSKTINATNLLSSSAPCTLFTSPNLTSPPPPSLLSSSCSSTSSILLSSHLAPPSHPSSSSPQSSLSSLLKPSFIVKSVSSIDVPPKKTSKRRPSNPDFALCKNRLYDPDKHCGVIINDTQKPCTRFITCKTHPLLMRRAVKGRSKPFDELMKEQKERRQAMLKSATAATLNSSDNNNNINNNSALSNNVHSSEKGHNNKSGKQIAKKVKKIPNMPTSESLERLAALLGLNSSSLSLTSLTLPKLTNEQTSNKPTLLTPQLNITDNLNKTSTTTTNNNNIGKVSTDLMPGFVLSSLIYQKPFTLHQTSSSASSSSSTSASIHHLNIPSLLCKAVPSSLSTSPVSSSFIGSLSHPTATDADMPTLLPMEKIEYDANRSNIVINGYNRYQQMSTEFKAKSSTDPVKPPNSRLLFTPVYERRKRMRSSSTFKHGSPHHNVNQNEKITGDVNDDEEDDDHGNGSEDDDEDDKECLSPKKFKSAQKCHHPKPIAVNRLNSWLYGCSYYATSRHHDRMRAAFLTIINQSPSPSSDVKDSKLVSQTSMLLTHPHLSTNNSLAQPFEGYSHLKFPKTKYTELKQLSSSSSLSSQHRPLCDASSSTTTTIHRPNQYSLPPNVAIVRTNNTSLLHSLQNKQLLIDREVNITSSTTSTSTTTGFNTTGTTGLPTRVSLNDLSKHKVLSLSCTKNSINCSNVQLILSLNNFRHSLACTSDLSATPRTTLLPSSSLSSSSLVSSSSSLSSTTVTTTTTASKLLCQTIPSTLSRSPFHTSLHGNSSNVTPTKSNNATVVIQKPNATSNNNNNTCFLLTTQPFASPNNNSISLTNNLVNINNNIININNNSSSNSNINNNNNIININNINLNMSNSNTALTLNSNATETLLQLLPMPSQNGHVNNNGNINNNNNNNIINNINSNNKRPSSILLGNKNKWSRVEGVVSISSSSSSSTTTTTTTSSSSSTMPPAASSPSLKSVKSLNLASSLVPKPCGQNILMRLPTSSKQLLFNNENIIYYPTSSSASITSASATSSSSSSSSSNVLLAPSISKPEHSVLNSILLINNKRLSLTSATHLIHPSINLSSIVSAQQLLLSSSSSPLSSLSSSASSSLASNFLLWNTNKKLPQQRQQQQTIITIPQQQKQQRLQLISTNHNVNNSVTTTTMPTTMTMTTTSTVPASMTLIKLNNSNMSTSTLFNNPMFKSEVKGHIGRLNGSLTMTQGQILLGRQVLSPTRSPPTLKNQMLVKELVGSDN